MSVDAAPALFACLTFLWHNSFKNALHRILPRGRGRDFIIQFFNINCYE